jgi:hypothetical protein
MTLLIAFLVVELVRDLVFDEFYHPGFIAEHPGDDLSRMLKTFRFNDRPSRMNAGIATPFEVMQISGGMDLLYRSVAVLRGVGGFDKITIHLTSSCKKDELFRNYIPLVDLFTSGGFSCQRKSALYNAHPTWLDEAVFAAYGWKSDLSDEEILEKRGRSSLINLVRSTLTSRQAKRTSSVHICSPSVNISIQSKDAFSPYIQEKSRAAAQNFYPVRRHSMKKNLPFWRIARVAPSLPTTL